MKKWAGREPVRLDGSRARKQAVGWDFGQRLPGGGNEWNKRKRVGTIRRAGDCRRREDLENRVRRRLRGSVRVPGRRWCQHRLSIPSSSEEAKSLRAELYAMGKRPRRLDVGGRTYELRC